MDRPTPGTPVPAAPNPIPPPQPPARRRWPGVLLTLLLLGALVGGSIYLARRPPAEGPHAGFMPGAPGGPPPGGAGFGLVTVGHATVVRARIPITLDALGTVTPLATVTLKAQVGGVLTEVLFTEGQMVRQGQLLARIDPRPYEQALMQARGVRTRDEAQLAAARVTLARYRTLLGQDSIARQDVDTQAALVQQLEGSVLADQASEAAARVNLEFTRITAPLSGRIGLRLVDQGNTVSAGSTTGIAVITQINPIDVQFAVPQDRIPEIQAEVAAGRKLVAEALQRTRSEVLDRGVFSTLDNVVDTTTGTVKAKARFPNGDGRLFPSQFVNLRLTLRTQDALVVPVTAVRSGPEGPYVYVIDAQRKVSMRAVKRGVSTVEQVVITEGLQAGELVVTEGGDRLSEGSQVQLQGERQADAPRPAASAGAVALPTAEQRRRMLDAAKGDPEQLARRKQFLDALDKGDPQALERWQHLQQRRREGGGGPGRPG
ncbi:efflux RND transporter periplasmic adaptor subunit [Pseudorhodoferax sp.]|uniref:efflux RND transporter periplasmic adaptor subunit n=1 Tax=Pseudorhodoferax sp. TaxID=1993553 RepID=UPI0039E40C8B